MLTGSSRPPYPQPLSDQTSPFSHSTPQHLHVSIAVLAGSSRPPYPQLPALKALPTPPRSLSTPQHLRVSVTEHAHWQQADERSLDNGALKHALAKPWPRSPILCVTTVVLAPSHRGGQTEGMELGKHRAWMWANIGHGCGQTEGETPGVSVRTWADRSECKEAHPHKGCMSRGKLPQCYTTCHTGLCVTILAVTMDARCSCSTSRTGTV